MSAAWWKADVPKSLHCNVSGDRSYVLRSPFCKRPAVTVCSLVERESQALENRGVVHPVLPATAACGGDVSEESRKEANVHCLQMPFGARVQWWKQSCGLLQNEAPVIFAVAAATAVSDGNVSKENNRTHAPWHQKVFGACVQAGGSRAACSRNPRRSLLSCSCNCYTWKRRVQGE